MQTINKQTIYVDIRQTLTAPIPQFVQEDTNIINFVILDDGEPATLDNVGNIIVNYKRPDNQVISRILTATNNIISFQIGMEEMAVSGRGQLELQFYNSDGKTRLSTKIFAVVISQSIGTTSINPDSQEVSLLQQLITEVSTLNDTVSDAEDIRVTNENARISAESTRTTNETARQNSETTRNSNETTRESNENTRKTNETGRVNAETARVSSESTRESNESTRQSNETTRQNNENTRQTNETNRESSFSTALSNVTTATTNAETLINNTVHKGEYNPVTTYKVNNFVGYNGSTYMCIVESTGNLPTNITYFKLAAQRGQDGSGSISVNGIYPDLNGNVQLDATSFNMYTKAEIDTKLDAKLDDSQLGINGGVAKLDASGNVLDGSGQIVEGKVKSVNGQTGDVTLTIPTKTSDLTNDSNFITTSHSSDTTAHLTSTEHTKLTNIQDNAEVNQNAFSNIKVGATTLVADTKTDTIELVAGDNITLTPDATNDTITISSTDTIYTHPSTHPASMISLADTGNNFTATNVEDGMTELFTNVSNGKTAVANAITGKGQTASGSDTFAQLATAITNISTGKRFASGTAISGSSNYIINVSGLSFTPSIIITKLRSQTNKEMEVSFYVNSSNFSTPPTSEVIGGTSRYGEVGIPIITITSNGFQISVDEMNQEYVWLAIE